ncbi:MAG: imidazole glycerol phosphate synthase subunit HisH [Bryobacterales bacterium]|nr:imidazole glycerol phosphate synthase subunit HisH [Bryobacterales bacterium]
MIRIVDYGAGNLRSVENTLAAMGAPYEIVTRPEQLDGASKVLLPGVGHYGQIMRSLSTSGLRNGLLELIRRGTPFLGICIGLQSLFEGSEEDTAVEGLGVFQGVIRRFDDRLRVPHMGWNQIAACKECALLRGIPANPYVYFAHSYYAPVVSATGAVCDYGMAYTALIEDGNVYGVQFHPEKSGEVGMQVIKNFVELA